VVSQLCRGTTVSGCGDRFAINTQFWYAIGVFFEEETNDLDTLQVSLEVLPLVIAALVHALICGNDRVRTLANCWSWERLREVSWERSMGTISRVVEVKKEGRSTASLYLCLGGGHRSIPLFHSVATTVLTHDR
jgi:hypothetical protein